jgi:hypothetical protein
VRHTPQARTSINTSPAAGCGSGRSHRASGVRGRSSTIARIVGILNSNRDQPTMKSGTGHDSGPEFVSIGRRLVRRLSIAAQSF